MKPKEYKELVNVLTDKVLKKENISWKEGEIKHCMISSKPKFQKISPLFEYEGQESGLDREYMVFFQFVEHLVRDKNFTERMEQIYEVFPFLKDRNVKKFNTKTKWGKNLNVSLYRYGGDVFGVVFSFDVYERDESEVK